MYGSNQFIFPFSTSAHVPLYTANAVVMSYVRFRTHVVQPFLPVFLTSILYTYLSIVAAFASEIAVVKSPVLNAECDMFTLSLFSSSNLCFRCSATTCCSFILCTLYFSLVALSVASHF